MLITRRSMLMGSVATMAMATAVPMMAAAETKMTPAAGLVGYGEEHLSQVMMGIVPMDDVDEVRLMPNSYQRLVVDKVMPQRIAFNLIDHMHERLDFEYEVTLAAMLATGRLKVRLPLTAADRAAADAHYGAWAAAVEDGYGEFARRRFPMMFA